MEIVNKIKRHVKESNKKSICGFCGKELNLKIEFKDALSKKEYGISAMCQKCQDAIFN